MRSFKVDGYLLCILLLRSESCGSMRAIWMIPYCMLTNRMGIIGGVPFMPFYASDNSVAVLLPIYREHASAVERAINSIANQTYRNLFLVVVADDPDNKELIDHVECLLDRVPIASRLIINRDNIGLSRSLNSALSYIDASYVCRMDADDFSHPLRIERQLEYLISNQLDLIGCYINVCSESGELLYREDHLPITPDSIEKALAYKNCVMHPTWLGKREVFSLGYRQVPLAEDLDFLIRAVLAGYSLGNCPECLFDYTLSTGSVSRSNQYRQYLIQDILTREYRKHREVSPRTLDSEVERKWNAADDARYCSAVADLNAALGNAPFFDRVCAAARVFSAGVMSPQFRNKIMTNVVAALIQ